jgi:DNA-binding response OmpR family regulator
MTAKNGRTVLLVDDDATVVETVRDRLNFEGYRVLTAYSAEEGLRLALRRSVDLVILDIGMPGMNGFTFLQQVSQRFKSKPSIMVFTARSQLLDEIRAVPGVDAVLLKTSSPTELIAEVRRLMSPDSRSDSGDNQQTGGAAQSSSL